MDSKKSLSEISHLFLSEVRQRSGAPANRPTRVPPQQRKDPIADLTAEEFAASLEGDAASFAPAQGLAEISKKPEISVVLASHLSDQPAQRVRQYVRQVASQAGRVGLIEADGAEFVLGSFEANGGESGQPILTDELDGRRMSEMLGELSFEVSRWVISLANPRSSEAREILHRAPHWVLLTTADHDGVVATYRALKGLAELGKPRLSLVVLDARNDVEAEAIFQKLDSVARQFLGCQMEFETWARPNQEITENVLLHCRAGKEKAPSSVGPQWQLISELLAGGVAPQKESPIPQSKMKIEPSPSENFSAPIPVKLTQNIPASDESITEVVELPGSGDEQILDAIVRRGGAAGEWVQCPLKAPTCPQAVLAVGRDHRLVLVAVAGKGLSQLRMIGQALNWMNENRDLIRMALPQLAIEADAIPSVRLLVDHADLSAEQLQPLLHSEAVTVQAYRKIKWGPKRGLLLEAA
jgi:hypothetical protein